MEAGYLMPWTLSVATPLLMLLLSFDGGEQLWVTENCEGTNCHVLTCSLRGFTSSGVDNRLVRLLSTLCLLTRSTKLREDKATCEHALPSCPPFLLFLCASAAFHGSWHSFVLTPHCCLTSRCFRSLACKGSYCVAPQVYLEGKRKETV